MLRNIISSILLSRSEETDIQGQWIDCPIVNNKETINSDSCKLNKLIDNNKSKKNFSSTSTKEVKYSNVFNLYDGQLVVHLEHGIGRYGGMTILEVGGIKSEYIIIIYYDGDKLYIPVSSMHLISRYLGKDDKEPQLHKLGDHSWLKTRKKIVKKVRDMAVELLDMYVKRTTNGGFAYKYNKIHYHLFCQGFPFPLTIDQSKAITDVFHDMCQESPMDRLVCGDVGFGKTEVAMRAAFLAIENRKQVAVLVPTTLLAQQHFDNFCDRFKKWPIRTVYIEMISRFRCSNHSQVIKNTKEGKIDILIGTHKLLKINIEWYDLGLVIVDEEHRFGVKDKEKIKAMRSITNVDILTLTATPIPRTLNMAMNGLRDFSIIATPPERRLMVKTVVCEYNNYIIRDAILQEVLRGGQVYYLYNNVKYITKKARFLENLVPEANIVIGHAKMRELDLEQVMKDFYFHRFNVLVCSTIIEIGIDISNANTIIIERADKLGLAQLYQLRGRVGRSDYQAYAYLLTPPSKTLTNNARKRLDAIASFEHLGAGFSLAIRDLEIRGAGELLGENQSGQKEIMNFSVYMDLLKNAIEILKFSNKPSLEDLMNPFSEIELSIPTFLPDNYISDINTRLLFYNRIALSTNDKELEELKEELTYRFGYIPDPVKNLLLIANFRHRSKILGIKRITVNKKGGVIEFHKFNRIDQNYLIYLLQNYNKKYQLSGPTRLKFTMELPDAKNRLQCIDNILMDLYKHMLPN